MLPYIILFIIPVFAVLSPWRADKNLRTFLWIVIFALLTTFIGLRHEVGGDWDAYIENYPDFRTASIQEVYSHNSDDLGYTTLCFIVGRLGGNIYLSNFICSILFSLGLIRFSRFQSSGWLPLVVATPYLIIVVAMGYTRQAVAIGFLMWGIIDLINGKNYRFYLSLVLGILFHKGLIIMMPLALCMNKSNRDFLAKLLILSIFLPIIFIYIVLNRFDVFYSSYILRYEEFQMDSKGGIIRVALLLLPAILFFYFQKSWKKHYNDANVWLYFSIGVFILTPFVFFYSTATDRFALYFIPLQLVVFGRIPGLVRNLSNRFVFKIATLGLSTAVLLVWLIFAVHAAWWLPYQNWLTKDILDNGLILRSRQ